MNIKLLNILIILLLISSCKVNEEPKKNESHKPKIESISERHFEVYWENGKITKKREIYADNEYKKFNIDGNEIERKKFDVVGNLYFSKYLKYDKFKRLIRQQTIWADSTKNYTIDYTLDSNNNVITQTNYNWESEIVSRESVFTEKNHTKTTVQDFNIDGKLWNKVISHFNSHNNLIELKRYDNNLNLISKLNITYDKNNNEVKKVTVDKNNKPIAISTKKYDNSSNLIFHEEKYFISNYHFINRYKYSKEGKITSREAIEKKRNLLTKVAYHYNSKNLLERRILFTSKQNLTTSIEFIYDEKMRLINEKEVDYSITKSKFQSINYEYNKYGDISRKIIYSNLQPVEIVEYSYTYFDSARK